MLTIEITATVYNNKTGTHTVFHNAITDGERCYVKEGDHLKELYPPYSVEMKVSTNETISLVNWKIDG